MNIYHKGIRYITVNLILMITLSYDKNRFDYEK